MSNKSVEKNPKHNPKSHTNDKILYFITSKQLLEKGN